MATPGMIGGGEYHKVSSPQRSQLEHLEPMIAETSSQLQPMTNHTITIADYGCSDGANSVKWISSAVEEIRKTNPNCQINILFVDVPSNDWNFLISRVASQIQEKFSNVLVSSIGRSFYDQIALDKSVSMGVASTAFHWLKQIPCNANTHCLGQLSEQKEFWRQQAKSDWTLLLRNRAKELHKGGRLLVTGLLWNKEGQGYFHVFDILERCIREATGTINVPFSPVSLPIYIRSKEECLDIDLEALGLKITHHSAYEECSPYYTQYLGHQDLTKFAREFTRFIRAAYEPIIRMQMPTSQENPEATLNLIWKLYEDKVSTAAQAVSYTAFSILVLEKVQ